VRLRSLMLCGESQTVALVSRVCRELGVELHHCPTAETALQKFSLQRFHGVIVDDQDAASAASLLNDIQTAENGKKPLIVALAKTDAALDAVFGAGTHLVIYKPLTHDRLRNGLRAIRILMGRRRQRASTRVKVDITASLTVNDTDNFAVKILDISGGGAALSVQRPLSAVKTLTLSFALPGEQSKITADAVLVWKDVKGNVGIEFVNSDGAFSELVSNWMKAQKAHSARK
jgi:DNA-binding response OmpR family regulator